MRTLEEIGAACGTDKAQALGIHDYCPVYDEFFSPWRDVPITLLELGWGGYNDPRGGGESAAMWRQYFPEAKIVVIDVVPKLSRLSGVQLFCGSQDDAAFLAQVHQETGDYDIIVDDASHESFRTMKSFNLLWPRLRPGGFYVVEDLIVQEAAATYFAKMAADHLMMRRSDIDKIIFHPQLVLIRKK